MILTDSGSPGAARGGILGAGWACGMVVRTLALVALSLLAACAVEDEPVGSQREPLRDLDAIEAEFLDLLNDYRVANGLDPVMSDRALNQGARDYSQLMGESSWFDHTGPDGSSFTERMCAGGYTPACGPSTYCAENIAAGQRTALSVFEAWRGSPGHNRNMLSSSAVVVGIGRAEVSGSPYGVYWTNTFAGRETEHTVPLDAGPAPEPDAGPPPEPDAGPPPEPDAGPITQPDSGSPPIGSDAGGTTTADDGGTSSPDATIRFEVDGAAGGGTGGPSADPTGRHELRGGCSATGGAPGYPLALVLLALALSIRARPSRRRARPFRATGCR